MSVCVAMVQAMSMLIKLITILLTALIQVESGGQADAVGDNGRAVGILQIHKITVDDVNRIYKTNYTYKDRYSPKLSKEIASKYLLYWGNRYAKKHGTVNIMVLAKIHNGGPRGYQKKATVKYWLKVRKELIK